MALDKQARLDAACRMIKAVTGEPYGDGCRVTGVGIGIAEPGYGDSETVWVTGNWNDVTRYEDDGTRTVIDNRFSRLFDALERIGVSAEWLDEWYQCDGCYSLVRSQPDSYAWQPSYSDTEDGIYCRECATGEYLDETLAEYIGEDNRALSANLVSASELESAGFVRFNIPPAESGWHAHQTDKPADIVAEFESMHGTGHDWLFYVDEQSQFYLRFTLFYRLTTAADVS